MMKKLCLFAIAWLVAAPAIFAQKEDAAEKIGDDIKARDLKKVLTVIAGADMKGRDAASEGERKAAAYIESHFRRIGLQPGGVNGTYLQPFTLYRDSLISASLSVNGKAYELEKDFTVQVSSPAGTLNIQDVVFVGLGRADSTANDYAGLDVKGKYVMMFAGGGQPGRGNNMVARYQAARRNGAAGVIMVSPSIGRASRLGNMSLKPSSANPNQGFIVLPVSATVANAIAGETLSATSTPKAYKTSISLSLSKETQKLPSANVLGLLPGTDKKDEYVFITAHYDHVGHRGDSVIYYGADDDGSGTTAVMNIAERFATARKKGMGPRRSMVFMLVSAEEKGLLGSEYYGDNPIYPLAKTTVDLNIDMIGRIDPTYKGDSTNYVYVIGDDKLSSDLRPITDKVNDRYVKLELDRRFNDVNDPNRFYYRSDHYNFAKHGVPIIFYFNGTHADYHRPTDTVDKINFDLMEKRTRLVFYTAWEMANRDEMLKRDIPLNVPPR